MKSIEANTHDSLSVDSNRVQIFLSTSAGGDVLLEIGDSSHEAQAVS